MSRLLMTLPLIALMALGTSATAQDNTDSDAGTAEETTNEPAEGTTDEPAEETGEETTEETTETPAPGLDMGQEVQEDASYIKETYGDWQLQCFRSEAEEDPCQMYQLLHEDAGNPIAEFSMFKLPDDSQAVAGATIVVPLGTLLPQGLRISVDEGNAKAYNFSFCSMIGCFARIGFTQAEVDAFKSGNEAKLLIVPAQAPNERVLITTSLDGFTKAYENVSVSPAGTASAAESE